jgi:steroid 5-alpha reductase family enzyme
MFLGAALFATALMFVLYCVHLRTADAGIVDAGWAGGLGVVALFYALVGPGDSIHRLLLTIVACLWSFRLAYYLVRARVLVGGEDSRYAQLRRQWGDSARRRFAVIFCANAFFIIGFSIPFLMVALQPGSPGVLDALGLAVGLGAILGEGIADAQLSRWRADPGNRGRTCRAGLWRYSRHPNYFFEWLHWWAYVLLAAQWPHVLGALCGPVVMLLFLFRLTGIPHSERQAVASRGEDYRAYQRETSMFVPWFSKKRAS